MQCIAVDLLVNLPRAFFSCRNEVHFLLFMGEGVYKPRVSPKFAPAPFFSDHKYQNSLVYTEEFVRPVILECLRE